MNEKDKRALWLGKLKDLQKQLDAGRGLIFGSSFSDEHDELVTAVEEACLALEGYYDQEVLSSKQNEQLIELFQEIENKANTYKQKKRDDDHYSLNGENNTKIVKKGDKFKRLSAAQSLLTEVVDMKAEASANAAAARDREDQLSRPRRAMEHNRKLSVLELKEVEVTVRARRDIQASVLASVKKFDDFKTQYDLNDTYNEDRGKELSAGYGLHRGDILDFSDDAGFRKNYDKYREKLYRSISTYRKLEELKETNSDDFYAALRKMKISEKMFASMEDKINVLEMQTEYLDLRAKIVSSPEYVRMDKDELQELKGKNAEELNAEIDRLREEDEFDNAARISLLQDMKSLKDMAQYGVKENPESTRKHAEAYEKTVNDGKISSTVSLFSAYEDHGGIDFKKKGFKQNIKDFFKSHKFNVGAKDATVAYTNGVFESQDLLNVGTNVFKGKARVLKVRSKVKSEHGSLGASAHVTVGTVKGAANVGFAISGSNLWETKIYAGASAEAYGVRGVAKGHAGYKKDWVKLDGKVEGNIGAAGATAQGGIGLIRYKDKDGNPHEGIGVSTDLSASAAVFTGTASGGLTLFGIRFGGKASVAAIGAGVKVKYVATKDFFSFGLSAALGLGAGFEISIDISGLKEKFKNWRARSKQVQKIKEKKAQDKANRPPRERNLASQFEVIEGPANNNNRRL